MERRPEEELHKPVYLNKLSKNIGLLQYHEVEKMHVEDLERPLECPRLEEKGNPTFHHVKPIKRRGFCLDAVAKVYDLPKQQRKENTLLMEDVRACDDSTAMGLFYYNNCFMLQVIDCSEYCVLYEHYLYDLEEVFLLQNKNTNVRPLLKRSTVDVVKGKQLIIKGGHDGKYTTTPLFREFMEHTLKFLNFLSVRGFAYGGLHPHNILIVDEEFTVKFRGVKGIEYVDEMDEDLDDFVRLVRFCVHGGGRNINDTDNEESICKEAKDFLSIFVVDENGDYPPSRSNYRKGFKINQLNILKHPLFWDKSMCMNYFLQTHAVLVACDLTLKKFDLGSKMQNFQKGLHKDVGYARNDLQAINVESPYPYNVGDVIDDIISSIRNFEGHYPDGLNGDNSPLGFLGSHPEECWDTLRERYPGLITGVHKVMITYTKYLSSLFKSHWGKFYPHVYR